MFGDAAFTGIGRQWHRGTCENLDPDTLSGRSVEIQYQVEKGRRFRLTDIRIAGTNKLTFEDVEADLKSQKASAALGLIPFLGYGRGYTSLTLLEQDKTNRAQLHARDRLQTC